jgi:hypothetical protein
MSPQLERAGYVLVNVLLLFAAALLNESCTSAYELAKARFATVEHDTTFSTITTTIPRDSVVVKFKTDTTRYIEKTRQGRATVTIIREPTNTTVIANCDSLSKSQQVATSIENQKWGVDPAYQKWRYISFGLIGLFALFFLLLIALIVGVKFFTRNYSVTPRNGTPAESN